MFSRAKKFLLKLFIYETSPHKLAVACAIAVYIAFSPFFGLHTLMLIGSGMFFKLNIPLLLIIGYVINNPFSMIPIYMSGYAVGYWILHECLEFHVCAYNPWWMESVNNFLHAKIGISHISFWAFMIGGNCVGIILGCVAYPLMHHIFKRLSIQQAIR
ncbi:DUF2062 domain-containing protein [Candidatus Babeliales bacterium]|nr:DUF2062 domain-containing protein [Candidatus Babeliales bacterium]